jgi:hypothetical protein
MSKPRKIKPIMPQTQAMLSGRFSINWNSGGRSSIAPPEPRKDQFARAARQFTTIDGIDPRLAELLWNINSTRKLCSTIDDQTTEEQAREIISDDENKFTRLCQLALKIGDDAFFHQVAYATAAMRDLPPKAEFVFLAWRECGKENALLADICRTANANIRAEGITEKLHPEDTTGIVVTLDNRTVQDILAKLGLPAIKANTDPKSRTRPS